MEFTLKKLIEGYSNKYFSPLEIIEWYLEKINNIDPEINAYITVTKDRALKQAGTHIKHLKCVGKIEDLTGVPVSYKDCIDVVGVGTTNGSKVESEYIATHNASITERLERLGSISLGKNNMYEYATGVVSENPYYGNVVNPINFNKTAGGSSSGSAASVAAGMAVASIGTDTSGSVRIPAACCGVIGIKPTYNLMGMKGVMPLSWTLDHLGVITSSVEDLQIFLQKVSMYSEINSNEANLSRLNVGIPNCSFHEYNDQTINEMISVVYKNMEKLGATLKIVDTSFISDPVKVSRVIGTSEMTVVHNNRFTTHYQDYSEKLNQTFKKGKLIPAFDYLNALQTKKEWTFLMSELFKQVDVIITPTIPINVPNVHQNKVEHSDEEIEDIMVRYTCPFNITGHPALSMPSGVNKDGVSQGFQIIANYRHEDLLCKVGKDYEDHFLK